MISVPHNLKTEVLSWPFPFCAVVPLENRPDRCSAVDDASTEEIKIDSEKEKLLLPVFTGLGCMPLSPRASFTLKF